MLRALRAGWVACAAGAVAALVLSGRHAIDWAEQVRYSRDVRRLAEVEARLSEQVLRSRLGQQTSYDPLVQAEKELANIHRELGKIPGFLPSDGREEIARRLAEEGRQMKQRERLIDAFKTENAVLRNSLRYFPIAAVELRERAGRAPGGGEVAARVHELMGEVLLFNTAPDPELLPRVERSLAAARAAAAAGDPGLRPDVEVLLAHAGEITVRKPRVDRLSTEVVALASSGVADAVERAYSVHFNAAVLRAGRERALLFGLVLAAVVLAALDVVSRTKLAARALREVTEKLAATNVALQHEKEREHELADLRSRFVSMTSHEFRTPLSIILSSTELLEAYADRWPAEKKALHYERVKGAIRGMTRMLDEVLLIGRAEAGALECKPAPFDLARLCEAQVAGARSLARPSHQVSLSFEGEHQVVADEKLLSHILSNLLSNAIKYSPDGGPVECVVQRGPRQAKITVSDRGIGIPSAHLARLFQSFQRANNVRNIPGTGLGLAVLKAAVDVHGGQIHIDSEEGQGTRVEVLIPLPEAGLWRAVTRAGVL